MRELWAMTRPSPTLSFADAGHRAAFYAVLDAADRIELARRSLNAEGRLFWAGWAARSLEKVPLYLAESKVYETTTRPLTSPLAILRRAELLEREARVLAGSALAFGGPR